MSPPAASSPAMHESDWDVIEDLFLRALVVAPGERPEFLDHHCGDDAALRGEIEGMLAAEKAGGKLRWMERLEAESAPDRLDGDAALRPPG